jgi:hypothetical protein
MRATGSSAILAIVAMVLSALIVHYFKRKGWLGLASQAPRTTARRTLDDAGRARHPPEIEGPFEVEE